MCHDSIAGGLSAAAIHQGAGCDFRCPGERAQAHKAPAPSTAQQLGIRARRQLGAAMKALPPEPV